MIVRHEYLSFLDEWKDKNVIKVITGIRRSGKSTLLAQYRSKLLSDGVKKNQILSLNFEDFAFEELTDPHKLYPESLRFGYTIT